MGASTNREETDDPDKMPQNAALNVQAGVNIKSKQSLGTEVHLNLEMLTCEPLNRTNALSQAECMKPLISIQCRINVRTWNFFFYFSTKIYVVGTQKNRLI